MALAQAAKKPPADVFGQGPLDPSPLTTLHEAPHPVLRQTGLNMGVQGLNQKVQKLTDAHQNAFGTKPSPGLVLDVLRSPVLDSDYPSLFNIPKNQSDMAARKAVAQHRHQYPDDYFVRGPASAQPDNPLYRTLRTNPVAKPDSLQSLLKRYPMVQAGALPIPGADGLMRAIDFLGQQGPTSDTPGSNRAYELQQEKSGIGYVKPPLTPDEAVAQQRFAVKTIREAKQALSRVSGIEFSSGPVFNQDDAQKVQTWQHSADYFQKQLAYQAQQAGQSVAQYVKSYNAKWGKGSPVHNGLIGHFLAAFPQQLWGHGGIWGDLASLPLYIKGTSDNPINIGLHGLTRTAGIVLDTVGGTVSQLKAASAAATAFTAYMAGLHGKGITLEQALERAREQLRANPSWMRIAAAGYLPAHEGRTLNLVDQLVNVAGDLILLRKASFTGERVAANDLSGALASDHLRATASWAYQDLKTYGRDGIGRASSRLDGGQGARALAARAAKLVQSGKMSESEFTRKVAELYAQGSTTVAGNEVAGPLLAGLRTDTLPTPGPLGRGWIQAKGGIRDWLDHFDQTASKIPGFSNAPVLVDTLRAAVSHAAPEGARLGYFQRELPEQMFNFVHKYGLAEDAQANKLESLLVRYQGTGNVEGIQSVEQTLHKLWDDKFPSRKMPMEPFRAQLSTETPSVFHFPGVADPRLSNALDSIGAAVKETNKVLNKVAKIHARIILSGLNPLTGLGGFSLLWKHVVGDGIRAFSGGVAALRTVEARKALTKIEQMAETNPAIERQLGAFLDRVRVGETRWALNKTAGSAESFTTGDKLLPEGSLGNVFRSRNYLTGAGGYLRRHLAAPELQGYRDGNLAEVILRDREARAAWKSNLTRNPDMTLDEYAGIVSKEYQEIEAALHARGITFDDALQAMRAGRGHDVDASLGRFIQKNQLDFPVRGGQVEQTSPFDELTSRWIGNVIMRPNKMWRTSLGRAQLGKNYAELRAAGWSQENAFAVSADLAEQIVKYHMLDFANKLQVEQDLRWVSYFATKHRLYFKWVLSTFLRHLGYAAAVADFQQTLNSQGGWTLPFHLFGYQWQIPLERLVWVPGREYDETSPLAQVVLDSLRNGGDVAGAVSKDLQGGANASMVTRSDIAVKYGTKLLKIEAGKAPATYGYAVAGLGKQNHDATWKAINEYQMQYFKDHGHYASESHAVKIVLRDQLATEYWRANLPLPVTPISGETDEEQKLMGQYMSLIDPAARRKFFDEHPGFSDHFGIYENPKVKIHNDTLFRRWNAFLDGYRQTRVYLNASLHDHPNDAANTTRVEKQLRALNAAYNTTRNQLLTEDAQQWGVDTHGLVPNGDTVPYGPWGKLVNKDPTFDPSHFLSTTFPKLEKIEGDIIGPLQRQMQQELTLLSDPKYVQSSNYTPDEVRTRKRELLQSLDVFKSYPTDALGVIRDQYQSKFVNPYWTKYNSRYNEIQAMPSDQRKQGDADFRAWRDAQDHPVIVDGVTFPSPARMAWATHPPQTRQERLSYLASKPLADLANYELDLLGVKHPPNVSLALDAIDQATKEYQSKYNKSVGKAQLLDVAKQIDKQDGYHGFYAYYVNTLAQPRIRQFERTSIYLEMPAQVKDEFDQVIGRPALELASRIAAGKGRSWYQAQWRKAMEAQIVPWLNDPSNRALREYLKPMGPNFLNELVSGG